MPSLPDELFSLLENKTLQAREAAEKAARNILAYLKVENGVWWGKKEDPQRDLWLGLRARARQLGYSVEENSEKDPVKRGLPQLVEEIAYEQWHRMLFARFLAENHLLMHPSGVAVSLSECEELALDEGEDDAWRLAARYAGAMLPGIFKQEDPCAQVRLTPSDHHALESILLEIPPLVFTCDDALGWMYQFWQSKKKKEVNDSERKIGGADISPVTQLFTEDYMVRFLLENSLGAWWAARHPNSPLVKEWEYLRFRDDGTPAAGSFLGWPERASEVTMMDPCCGSGHFLVVAFDMLRRMRMEEEGLTAPEAASRTLQKNIFGLEIDQRCTQIAWFALSLMGWKTGGYQHLSKLNIACTGIPVKGQLNDWLTLAGDDSRVKAGLERLYNLFKDAPDLGSLINPADVPLAERMFVADYEQVGPLLEKAVIQEKNELRTDFSIFDSLANNLIKVVGLLNKKYSLVITNVPYLVRGHQCESLQRFCENLFPDSKGDLATVFVERIIQFLSVSGTLSIVAPQNWLSLITYKTFRRKMFKSYIWKLVARMGPGAFRKIGGEIVNVALFIINNEFPQESNNLCVLDVSSQKRVSEKDNSIQQGKLLFTPQKNQLLNPDQRFVVKTLDTPNEDLLSKHVIYGKGSVTGDKFHYLRNFWEYQSFPKGIKYWHNSPESTIYWGGRSEVVLWEVKGHNLRSELGYAIRGEKVYGKTGVAIAKISNLPCTLYSGDLFDDNLVVLIPRKPDFLHALWLFCCSEEFKNKVRQLDSKLGVTAGTFEKVSVDALKWMDAANTTNNKIPNATSDDPRQWIFNGEVSTSSDPLHVAIAKLVGYQWPTQKIDTLHDLIDEDGIACFASVNGEPPVIESLRALLIAAYGEEWSGAKQEELLAAVDYSGKDLADWLRDSFFEQHCKLFQNRPFIWHIWDGRKDGFSALVNYHKLDRANLEKLTYTYLGAWITDRKKELERGAAGAEGRLLAAQALQEKLKLILAGEPPYDVYVRWKPLHEQPIGWEPDLNDGVRLNIRPFVTAGVLRSKFTINWNKDRGKNPDGSERLNDLHFTIAEKRTAREKQRK